MRLALLLLMGAAAACSPRPESRVTRASRAPLALFPGTLATTPIGGVARVAAARPSAPVPPVAEEAPLVLLFGGDVNLGRECGQSILADPEYDPFEGLGGAWRSADFRFVNLESQLSDQGGETQTPRRRLIFTGPPGGVAVLARAGIDVASTANNHAWDYGRGALFETLTNLRAAGVVPVGTGETLELARAPAVVQRRGRSIAVFAVTHIWNQGDFEAHEGKRYVSWAKFRELEASLREARAAHDFVFVSYHGGEEYIDAPVDRSRRFIDAVMATGVDAVIGHHPHVPQGIGWLRDRPVLYSLGNFVFAGHDERPWTQRGFFARLTFDAERRLSLAACPYLLDGHRPRSLLPPADDAELERFRVHLRSVSTAVGGSSVGVPDSDGCLPIEPPARRAAAPHSR